MKLGTKFIGMAAAACAAIASRQASAAFTSISKVFVGEVSTADGPRWVYRIYANFTDPNDQLIGWGSSPSGPPTTIKTEFCLEPPTPFYQAPGGYNTAPDQAAIDKNPDVRWDTFATIGVTQYEQGVPFDMTSLSPQFPPFINGGTITLTNKSVFVPGDQPQAHAGFTGDGDAPLRVLMMQLTVLPYTDVKGTIGTLSLKTPGGTNYVLNSQSWGILEFLGRCCLPGGGCAFTSNAACDQFLNGYWLGCEGDCSICAATCQADIVPPPGDGNVDVDDLFAVINAWGPCPLGTVCAPDVAPDENGNDVVDVDDLFTVINNWGPCR